MRWLRLGGRRPGKTADLLAAQKREVGPGGWTCHICGDYRPDARISVYSTAATVRGVEVQQNVRYCNDRARCVEGVADVKFVP